MSILRPLSNVTTYLIFTLRVTHSSALSALVNNLAKFDALVADAAGCSLVLGLLDKMMLPVHPCVAVAPHHWVPRSRGDL